MDVADVRQALHEAVDRVIDEFIGAGGSAGAQAGTRSGIAVLGGEDNGPFAHRWPDGTVEEMTSSRRYSLVDQDKVRSVLVAWTERGAWGRIRKRAVVFGESPASLYPWTEFVESDDGRYAAGIPDPAHPRALLREGSRLPYRFEGAAVERTDKLFRSVRKGPSVRLVVRSHEEQEMVRHGYWVAALRNR